MDSAALHLTAPEARPTSPAQPWWRDAVVYEVYPRSFADGNGDGEGDLAGLRERLPYLTWLGVDALWIAPWYPSPMADGGYDVSDYRDIDPRYGRIDEAKALIDEARARGLRVIIDLVANHTSVEHPWFRSALDAGRGSPERERYILRDGRGDAGELPPNNWISAFGGSAWTRVADPDGAPGQWYLHSFAPEQPDLDWTSETVREDFDGILRFWFDLGVDGIRVDAAPAMAKAPGLPDADYDGSAAYRTNEWADNPHWDVDTVHEIFRRWRALADTYGPDKMFVAEAVVRDTERLSNYVRPDELHTAFNFTFLKAPWSPALRSVIDDTMRDLGRVGATPTWVMSSHDEIRLATRLGRDETAATHLVDPARAPSDPVLGERRARAAMLLMLALPGSTYLYQGDELGLPFVDDIPESLLQDPIFSLSHGALRGRDGSRVPMPWSGSAPPFGFTDAEATPWLPIPSTWTALTVDAQRGDPSSVLSVVRHALAVRRLVSSYASEGLTWNPSPPSCLDFSRGDGWRCVTNFAGPPLALGDEWRVAAASSTLGGRKVPEDTTVWLIR